jgi:hypothetical protein
MHLSGKMTLTFFDLELSISHHLAAQKIRETASSKLLLAGRKNKKLFWLMARRA